MGEIPLVVGRTKGISPIIPSFLIYEGMMGEIPLVRPTSFPTFPESRFPTFPNLTENTAAWRNRFPLPRTVFQETSLF